MVKKKSVRKISRKNKVKHINQKNKNNLSKGYKKIDKKITNFEDEINDVFKKDVVILEKWMVERRKFFLKLGIFVTIFLLFLLVLVYAGSWF